jgi:hypothetical protein
VQTGSFGNIRRKLQSLLDSGRRIELVYPIAELKWIVYIDPITGKEKSRRRSPRTGALSDLFDEILYIPELVGYEGFSVMALIVHIEEIRCDDGKGSWRRKGVSITDTHLVKVTGEQRFCGPDDYLRLLPENLDLPFSTKSLAAHMRIRARKAGRIAYALRRMGAVKICGKKGNMFLYKVNEQNSQCDIRNQDLLKFCDNTIPQRLTSYTPD